MRQELEQSLVEDFPTLFRDYGKDPRVSCMAFGCDIGDGWESLLRRVCEQIEDYSTEESPIVFDQIKEKWGGLRIYQHGGKYFPPLWWRRALKPLFWVGALFLRIYKIPLESYKERWGIKEFWWHVQTFTRNWVCKDQPDPIQDAIDAAEKESFTICEYCGKPGTPTKTRWIKTLCEECKKER